MARPDPDHERTTMTLGDALIVLVAGFGAGALTSSVGVASLVSFPVLVALGLPPVLANMTNAVGLVPAGVGGGLGTARRSASTRA